MGRESEILTVWFTSPYGGEKSNRWRIGEVPRGVSSEKMHRLCEISHDCTIGYQPHKMSKIDGRDCYIVRGLTGLTKARRMFRAQRQ